MDQDKDQTLKFRAPVGVAKRLNEVVAARRKSVSKPILHRSQAILEAVAEWLERQAA